MAAALGRPSAPGAYAFAVKAPPLPVVPAWTGLYTGVSFGPASIRAATSVATHSVDQFTFPGPPTLVQTDTTDRLDLGNGRRWGALSDMFVGYNFRLGGNLIAGVQAEGTIANAQAQLQVARTDLDVLTQVFTPPGSTGRRSAAGGSTRSLRGGA